MNRPSGGNGEFARGASAAAIKGAALIALAVIVGVFLLQRVDTSNAGSTTPVSPHTTTTTRHRPTTTTSAVASSTTSVAAAPAKSPDQLRVLVLNGGAATGAAARMRTSLEQVGYTNQPQASTWSGHHQVGVTILCKPGQEGAAVALSQQTALKGAKVVAFPSPAPPDSSDADCVVVVGG